MVRGKPLSFDRDEVLAKAMELLWHQGYQNTGMSDLLDHMGIQRQSFYNTFGSKEQLFLEAVRLYSRTELAEITRQLEAPGNPLDNIRHVFDTWESMAEAAPNCGCMLGNTIAEFGLNHPEIGKMLKENIFRLEEAFFKAFARAAEQGLLPDDRDPRVLARSLVVMSQGMALMSKLGYGKEMVADMRGTLDALVTR